MRNVFILGLLTILFACNPKPIVNISGTIQNQATDNIIVSSQLLKTSDTLTISDKSFSGTLKVEQPGIYDIKNGNYGFQVYLKPGAEMQVAIDIEALKEGAMSKIDIKGSDETKLMLTLSGINAEVMKNFRASLSLSPDSFEIVMNAYQEKTKEAIGSFTSSTKASAHFLERINMITNIQISEKYMYYTMYHPRLAPNDTMPIPQEYYTAGDDIALDNTQLYNELNTYKYFVLQKYDTKCKALLKEANLENESVAELNKHIDIIVSLDASQDIKDELGNQLLSSYSYSSDELKEVYKSRYAEMIQNKTFVSEFKALVKKLEALQPGSVAPTFAYKDINGQLVDSKSLKGKVIYIDVWATWCGPCMGEIPHLKALEKELHGMDIAFVSISVDGDKGAWEKMVAKKELKGYQLFADGEWESDIIKDYAIEGIPRFILIDKEGKLVNANAKRPSSKDVIKKQLIQLAKS